MSSAAPPHKPIRAPHHALSCTSDPVPRPNQRIMSLDTIPMKRSAPAPRSMASGNTLKLFVDAITPGLSTLSSRTSCHGLLSRESWTAHANVPLSDPGRPNEHPITQAEVLLAAMVKQRGTKIPAAPSAVTRSSWSGPMMATSCPSRRVRITFSPCRVALRTSTEAIDCLPAMADRKRGVGASSIPSRRAVRRPRG